MTAEFPSQKTDRGDGLDLFTHIVSAPPTKPALTVCESEKAKA